MALRSRFEWARGPRCWGQINAGTRCVMLARYSAKKHKDVKIPRRHANHTSLHINLSSIVSQKEDMPSPHVLPPKDAAGRPTATDDILQRGAYLRVRSEEGAPGREVDGSRAVVGHHVVRRLAVVRVGSASGAAAVGSHGSVAVVSRFRG